MKNTQSRHRKRSGRAGKRTAARRLAEWHRLPWAKWYGQCLTVDGVPEEFGQALLNLFPRVSRRYRAGLSSPIWISREKGEKGHPAGAKLEDAAQEVLYATLKGIVQSDELRERYAKGMKDAEFAKYIFTMMDNNCLQTCRLRAPLWWHIHDRLEDLGELSNLDKRRKLYVPSGWLKGGTPSPLDFTELRARLNSVSLYKGNMGEHLSEEKLKEVVERIFQCVQAPIPLATLTDTVLQVFRAKADEPVSIDQPKRDARDEEAVEPVADDGSEVVKEPWVTVDVPRWLHSALGNLKREHLLVLKYQVCFENPSLEKTAACVRHVLGSAKFGKSKAGYRYNDAVNLLRVMPRRGGSKRAQTRSGKYDNPFLPSNEEEERTYLGLFCDVLHKWLATYGYTREFLDQTGANVEKAYV